MVASEFVKQPLRNQLLGEEARAGWIERALFVAREGLVLCGAGNCMYQVFIE